MILVIPVLSAFAMALRPPVHSPIILGSASPTRRALLAELGVPLVVLATDLDERALGDRSPGAHPGDISRAAALVTTLAHATADALLARLAADPELLGGALLLGGAPPPRLLL